MDCLVGDCSLASDLALVWVVWVRGLAGFLAELSFALPGSVVVLAMVGGLGSAVLAASLAESMPVRRGWHDGEPDPVHPLFSPATACDHCGEARYWSQIHAFVANRGVCPECDEPLSRSRLFMEVAAIGLSGLVAATASDGPSLLALLLLTWWVIPVAWVDWRHEEIPDILSMPLGLIGLVMSPFDPDTSSRVLGMAIAGGFMWVIFAAYSRVKEVDANSYGDVALCAAAGAWLGACAAMPFILVGVLLSGAVAYWLKFRYDREGAPMAPTLCLALVLCAATGLTL